MFNFKPLLKCESCNHIIAFSSEKVVLSASGEKYAPIKHCLQVKTVQKHSKQICWGILMRRQQGIFQYRKWYYRLWSCILAGSGGLKLKSYKLWVCFLKTHSFSLKKTFIVRLELCGFDYGSLWCFYKLFGLSFWRHPFTTEHPFMSKWCNAEFLQIFSNGETNSSTEWMA